MPFLSFLKNLFVAPDPRGPAVWSPRQQNASRWSVVVRNSFSPIPWSYSTCVYQNKKWYETTEQEKLNLSKYVKIIADEFESLPESLWVEERRQGEDFDPLCICCDIRLCQFSLAAFDTPEVRRDIVTFAEEVRHRIASGPESNGGEWRMPERDYDFEYHTGHGVTFAVCWYRHTDWLSGLGDDNLRPVPDADPKTVRANLTQLLEVARLLVDAPAAKLLDAATLPPVPKPARGRPAAARLLIGPELNESFAGLDSAIEPLHDIAISIFQGWLDSVAGQACPLYEDNKRLVAMTLERVDRYGIRLFFERDGELLKVRVEARPATAAAKINPDSPAAQAGLFAVRVRDAEKAGSVNIGEMSVFPQLIAARDIDHARGIRAQRSTNKSK